MSLMLDASSECILINPNIATIQTSHQMASEVYCESRRGLLGLYDANGWSSRSPDG